MAVRKKVSRTRAPAKKGSRARAPAKKVSRARAPAKEIKPVQKASRALSPFEEMESVMDRMDRLFDEYFPGRRQWGRGLAPFEETGRFFEDYFPRGWLRPFRHEWPAWGRFAAFEERWPRINVINEDDAVVIHAEVPGVNKEDLDVSVTDQDVTIKGTTGREEEKDKGGFYRLETARGAFSRTIPLPVEVDSAKAKATFKDGVMELRLPKVGDARRQRIKVE